MRKKRLLAFAMCVCMLATSTTMAWATTDDADSAAVEQDAAGAVEADELDSEETSATQAPAATDAPAESEEELDDLETIEYYDIQQDYQEQGYKSPGEGTEIVLTPEQATGNTTLQIAETEDEFGKKKNAIAFTEDAGCETVEYTFNVEKAGLYEIHMEFMNTVSYGMQIQRRVYIDGVVPCKELNNVYLYRYFEEEGEVQKNAIGDEVWPKNREHEKWQTQGVVDYDGYYSTPLQFYFDEGEHTIAFEYIDQDIYLGDVTLKAPQEYKTYEEVQKEYEEKGYKKASGDAVVFEAEETEWKSDSTIRRDTDTDPATSPSSGIDRVLNTIGGDRWSDGNQSITWKFTVEEAGLYNINMRAMQNFSEGMPSARQILIDGEIPFEELVMYQFEYQETWAAFSLHDENGDPYEFYFDEGEHEITMVVKSGQLYDVIRLTNDIISDVSDEYLKITKVTTTNPDTNYEYNLYKSMPELKDEFNAIGDKVQQCIDAIQEMSNMTTAMEGSYEEILSTLRGYAEDPDQITADISGLEDMQTSLGDYILSMGDMPLTIDYFSLDPSGDDFKIKTSNGFQRFLVSVQSFLASFYKDYDAVGSIYAGEDDMEVIDVWMARGTEWGEVLKDLIDESFTSETNIAVNLNILPSGQLNAGNVSALMLSITSGSAPDVAMGVAFSEPAEFAFRDAVVDLTQFSDYEEYSQQFYQGMLIPYEYEKDGHTGIYGIPETMDFTVLMYRSDILESLNLEVPKTWDDLFNTTLPVLVENNMSFSFPVDTTASSNSPSSLKGMTMFLIQQGGSYYTDDGMYSALDTPEAYNAFKQWCDLYVSYGLDAESSFFTRFRTGTLPIGVGSYASYMQVLTQAPELYGRWGIAPMLGTGTGEYDENGEEIIDNRVGGASLTACQIMSQTEKEQESWEFLKWWMSEETQISFGREIEATMGIEARWNTANVNAFEALPWDQEDIEIIENQMAGAEEQPIVLGGYFTTRHLVNAWNRVYLSNENPRDALEEAVKDINAEIRTKHEEYGFVYED